MSVVKGKLVKMEVIQVGEYEFTKQDIIGHGAFAMVYKGRKRKVPTISAHSPIRHRHTDLLLFALSLYHKELLTF